MMSFSKNFEKRIFHFQYDRGGRPVLTFEKLPNLRVNFTLYRLCQKMTLCISL